MKFVRNFWDLEVYKVARELQTEVFELSKKFPSDERFSLTDQIRRSSRSVGAQIAESWGKRRYEKHFISKLTDADSEQFETQHWLLTAVDSAYITQEEAKPLILKCRRIGKMLGGAIANSQKFCDPEYGSKGNKVKEGELEYFVWPERGTESFGSEPFGPEGYASDACGGEGNQM